MWCKNTTSATQFTTLTPQKHHTKSPTFLKMPHKITFHHAQKNNKNALQNHKQTETINLLQSANP
jgi:hypothetical protein